MEINSMNVPEVVQRRTLDHRTTWSNRLSEIMEKGFTFEKFGRFQVMMYGILGVIIMQSSMYYLSWHIFIASHTSCEKPRTVQDSCSKKCERVSYAEEFVGSNFLTMFHWLCDRQYMTQVYSYSITLSTIVSAVFISVLPQRFGRKPVIFWTLLVHLLAQIVLLVVQTEVLVIIVVFLTSFAESLVYMECKLLLLETNPVKFRALATMYLNFWYFFGAHVYVCFWYLFRHWIEVWLVKCILLFISIVSSTFLLDSAILFFVNDRLEDTIEILERAAKINKTTIDDIRGRVEAVWRTTRTFPKSSDSFLNIFYFHCVSKIFYKTTFIYLTAGVLLERGWDVYMFQSWAKLNEMPMKMILVFFSSMVFIVASVYVKRKPLLFACYVILCFFYLVEALVDTEKHTWYMFDKFFLIPIVVAWNTIDTICLELYPTTIRSSIFAWDMLMGYFLGPRLSNSINSLQKARWLPSALYSLLCLISAILTNDLVETKGSNLHFSLRETEVHIRTRQLKEEGFKNSMGF